MIAPDRDTTDIAPASSSREVAHGASTVPALRPEAAGARPMGFGRWFWVTLVVAGLVLGALAFAQVWTTRPTPVLVETVTPAPVTRVLAVNGRIAALQSVDVGSVVTGTLARLFVAEGASVEAGETLAQIDAAAQSAVVRQALAGLDAALVAQRQASETYQRNLSLGDNVPRAVLEADAHAVETAEQEVARLAALLDQAQITLETYSIHAPVSGTVLDLSAEQGQVISPSSHLLTLADLSDLIVEADVDEAYATQIAINQSVVLQLAGETSTHPGHVEFISARVNEATGGLAIEVGFDEPVMAPIGLSVTMNIIVDQQDAALSIPLSALVSGTQTPEVFVVSDGVAQLRSVDVLDWPAARLIVTSGLTQGEVVIVDASGIADAQAVSPE